MFATFSLLSICLLFLLFPATNGLCADEETHGPGKMVFLPFTVQTDKPQPYLREGLADILASRMTSQTGQIAVHRSKETTQLAKLLQKGDQQAFTKMLKKIDADYLVIGNLEQQDKDYEITVYVFNKTTPLPFSFSKTMTGLDKTIPSMDELSMEISEQVFNKRRPRKKTSTASSENQGTSAFQTAHPDRAYRDGLYQATTTLGVEDENLNLLSSWQSKEISEKVRAMGAADLNGDGEQEIVLVQMGSIALYHCNDGRFEEVTEQLISEYLSPHAVSLADLDGNGLMEIYISANIGDKPSSLVLEWDGSDVRTLSEKIPYYIRLGTNLEGKQVLIGQNGSNKGITGRTFCQLTRSSDGTFTETKPFTVPEEFNLFDFIRVDLEHNGSLEFIGLTVDNRLVVMNQEGGLLWSSEQGYGASRLFLGATETNMEEDFMPRYLHLRLIARDLDGDGTPEIIVGKNRMSSTVKYFQRLRFFKGSSINALLWDGSKMTSFWETKTIPGYVTDYQLLKDSNHPGLMRLYFVESSNNSPLFFWKSENSVIHLYEMGPRETENPQQ